VSTSIVIMSDLINFSYWLLIGVVEEVLETVVVLPVVLIVLNSIEISHHS